MLLNCGSARRLCRGGATSPCEAGGREVESSPQGVGTAARSRGRAQVKARIVEDKASNSRYQGRETKHLYVDAQVVSTSRCLHLVLDACI